VRRGAVASVLAAIALVGAACSDYGAYLGGPQHASYAANATKITVANATTLHSVWTWNPTPKSPYPTYLYSSPITSGGVIYIGAATGDFYAIDAAKGTTIWRKQLPVSTCDTPAGLVSSATVANDPVTNKPVVYVGGADHYLYALDPATGATLWRSIVGGTDSHYYNWSSPTVVNGKIYMGVAITCDVPFTNGVEMFDQHTGNVLARWYIAGPTGLGAAVYTSAAVASDGSVFVTTGDENGGSTQDAESVVKLRGTDLTRLGGWQVPGVTGENLDFNASPTLFSAGSTPMVGACNKNGVFYAFAQVDLTAPAWTQRLGVSEPSPGLFCGGSAAYDGTKLYVGANQPPTKPSPGSIYQLDPATGHIDWYRGLGNGPVLGTPSLDGAGVLAVPTFNQAANSGAVYLVDKSNGTILNKLAFSGPIFAQPVFEDGQLLVAGPSLQAFAP
jgi:outer membrane protein assembly factor BamB